jgi:hypothetical protein
MQGGYYLVMVIFYLGETFEAQHYNILQYLVSKNLVSHEVPQTYDTEYPEDFIAVIREGNSNVFGQSSAYDDIPEYYYDIFRNANRKYPFKFTMVKLAE